MPKEFILQSCYPRADDIIFAAGTLIEGIGNAFSDLDVYVITKSLRKVAEVDLSRHHRVITPTRELAAPEHAGEDVFLIHTVVPNSFIKVDIEFKTFDEVEDLFGRIDEIFDYASNRLILLTKTLTDREEVLVHRLLNCVILQNEAAFAKLRQRLSPARYAYIAYRWVASDFSKLLDIVGAWRAGDIDRTADLARESVILQLSGYLRLRGVTNLRRKWLITYLRAHDDPPGLFARAMDFIYLRGVGTAESKRRYVEDALDFIDEIYALSRPFIERLGIVPSGKRALEMLADEERRFGSDSQYGAWELAYRARAYTQPATPTRALLEAAPALAVSPIEVAWPGPRASELAGAQAATEPRSL